MSLKRNKKNTPALREAQVIARTILDTIEELEQRTPAVISHLVDEFSYVAEDACGCAEGDDEPVTYATLNTASIAAWIAYDLASKKLSQEASDDVWKRLCDMGAVG